MPIQIKQTTAAMNNARDANLVRYQEDSFREFIEITMFGQYHPTTKAGLGTPRHCSQSHTPESVASKSSKFLAASVFSITVFFLNQVTVLQHRIAGVGGSGLFLGILGS